MNEELITNNNLARLSKYLNYKLTGSVLFLLSFMSIAFIFIVSIAAIIFTPFMIYVLYQEEKKGWILFFFVLVGLPLILSIILFFTATYTFPWIFIVLGLFYLYCFLLRMEANNWMKERRAKLEYLLEKQKHEDEQKAFLSQFKN